MLTMQWTLPLRLYIIQNCCTAFCCLSCHPLNLQSDNSSIQTTKNSDNSFWNMNLKSKCAEYSKWVKISNLVTLFGIFRILFHSNYTTPIKEGDSWHAHLYVGLMSDDSADSLWSDNHDFLNSSLFKSKSEWCQYWESNPEYGAQSILYGQWSYDLL